MTKPPFPPSGGYLSAIRESSRQLRLKSNIRIPPAAINRLLRSDAFRSSFQRISIFRGFNLPLRFDSHLDELNLISVLSFLNFASGYRSPLHEQLRRGAWDTMRAFVFSLYITSTSEGDLLSSRGMQSISMTKVAELMGVSLHIEKPQGGLPGVIVGELGGPLYDLVKQITEVLNQTGEILVSGGYLNLGSFVLEALKEAGGSVSQDLASIEVVLERLVKAFPALQDMAVVDGQPVYCFKKALFLVHAIEIRFGSISPPPFPIPSTQDNSILTDNVIPSMLIHLGILDLSQAPGLNTLFPSAHSEESLQSLLGPVPNVISDQQISLHTSIKKGPSLSNAQAFKLRAAAIDACGMIISQAHSLGVSGPEENQEPPDWIREITLPGLDVWLWSVAKDRPDYRALERFAQRDTVFY